MAHERRKSLYEEESRIPGSLDWPGFVNLHGVQLKTQYLHILATLSEQQGILGTIFCKAENKIQDPAKLQRLVELIDNIDWTSIEADILGNAYEEILEKNATDTKSGAGQYFTSRALIQAIVDVMQPRVGDTIADPACGTGGFLLAAHDYIVSHYGSTLTREQVKQLQTNTFYGWEIVHSTARLCVMNLFLHGIIGDEYTSRSITVSDSLISKPEQRFSLIISNPPFGRQSSGVFSRRDDSSARFDFIARTSNKQLNFVQHIKSLLKDDGRAAIVLPDNVLFEGGAGEKIREDLLNTCDVHTLLRLPTGIFYAQGVKANVLFVDRMSSGDRPQTKKLWIYDLRTNQNFTLRTNPLTRCHLDDFVRCYNSENRDQRKETERFRCFPYDELAQRDKINLDIFWLRDEHVESSENLPPPDVLARSIVEDLTAALEQFRAITGDCCILGEEESNNEA